MVAVGAIIENSTTEKILLIKRTNKADFSPGIWEDITGRMKQFEEPEDALHREVYEETGIKDFEVVKPLRVNHLFRGEKTAEKELIMIIYWVKTGSKEITLSGEHKYYKWLSPAKALELTDHLGVREDIKAFIRERGSSK